MRELSNLLVQVLAEIDRLERIKAELRAERAKLEAAVIAAGEVEADRASSAIQ